MAPKMKWEKVEQERRKARNGTDYVGSSSSNPGPASDEGTPRSGNGGKGKRRQKFVYYAPEVDKSSRELKKALSTHRRMLNDLKRDVKTLQAELGRKQTKAQDLARAIKRIEGELARLQPRARLGA